MVVPPGEQTSSFNCPGCFPVSSTIFALPRTVWAAISQAVLRGSPYFTPLSASASINMYTKAGEQPLTQPTASIWLSSISSTPPQLLKTAQDGLKAFDGKKTPDEYEAELTKLRSDMQAQADGFAFDSALNTAIMGKKGRSVKAVRALLDVDGLKSSKDRTTDIDKALEEAAKANPWAFGEAAEGSVHVSSGAEHGTPPTGDTDAVTAAFKAMNPGIKID